MKPVNPKGNQPQIFIGRTDAKAETPILGPPDMRNQFFGKDPDDEKDWGQEEKGTTGDEMVGWHHQLNGHSFDKAPRDGEGQESLTCCSPWGCKDSDTTEPLNSNNILLYCSPLTSIHYYGKSIVLTLVFCWQSDGSAFFLSFFLISALFYFTILYWFCQTLTWIHHGCTWVPNHEPPPTSHTISSLWIIPMHQPLASCILYWT